MMIRTFTGPLILDVDFPEGLSSAENGRAFKGFVDDLSMGSQSSDIGPSELT